ncbi:hypothetical protein CDAR_23891 [Caerostris darwini]|uniref:Uncharacterized protein n=1 Tax=Caerostris darwini TaxID=1538125 RepID=A0AAV4UXT9_9ARAC|nr:hypothetical protein CDAR_23891 [Caerostris darwini]
MGEGCFDRISKDFSLRPLFTLTAVIVSCHKGTSQTACGEKRKDFGIGPQRVYDGVGTCYEGAGDFEMWGRCHTFWSFISPRFCIEDNGEGWGIYNEAKADS